MSHDPANYYAILQVSPKASDQQISSAYRRQALRWHPDWVPLDSCHRRTRSDHFRELHNAYYTLSDPRARRDYDAGKAPKDSRGFFGFGSRSSRNDIDIERLWSSTFISTARDSEFAVFEQGWGMVMPTQRFWACVGATQGASASMKYGNVWGAIASVGIGGPSGDARMAHGRDVYEVFQTLPQPEKAAILHALSSR